MNKQEIKAFAAKVAKEAPKTDSGLLASIHEEVKELILGSKPLYALKKDNVIVFQRVESRTSITGEDYLVAIFIDINGEEYPVSARALAALKVAPSKAASKKPEWSDELQEIPYLQKLIKEEKLILEVGLTLQVGHLVKVKDYTKRSKEQRYVNQAYLGHSRYLEDLENGVRATVAHRSLMKSGVDPTYIGETKLLLWKPIFVIID